LEFIFLAFSFQGDLQLGGLFAEEGREERADRRQDGMSALERR